MAKQSSPRSARKELSKSARTPSSAVSMKSRPSSSAKGIIDSNANSSSSNNNNCDDAADESLGIMSPSDMGSRLPSLTASMISNFAWETEEEADRTPQSSAKNKEKQRSPQVIHFYLV